ncbi:hypothetical protein SELMODRAFT_414574 [Selaginella moellendorffii]|nr:hypothetical protein SELMODRAFT_414574 [Selaginella moellendorffii]
MEDVLAEKLSRVCKFDLPFIPCSIPFECHPDFTRISKDTDAWALRMLSITDPYERKKALQGRHSLYSPMIIPRGESSKAELSSKHTWTMFVLDDIAENFSEQEGKKAIDILLEVAEGSYVLSEKEKEKHPSHAMFEEVMSSFRSLMDPPLFARYMNCLRNYLDSVVEEASLRIAKSIPSLEKYRLLRRETSFMEADGGIMCEFCMDLKLHKSVVESPDFVAFVKAVIDHVVLEAEAEILQLQQKLIKLGEETGDKDLVEYATWYPCVASGNLRWSYVTGRYHGLDNPLLNGEPFQGTWFLHPEATLILPLGSKCGNHPFITI